VDDFKMASRSQKATDLMGRKSSTAPTRILARLEDIVVDANSGRILYGVLSFGGFLAWRTSWFAIPWESLELPADAKNVVLNVKQRPAQERRGLRQRTIGRISRMKPWLPRRTSTTIEHRIGRLTDATPADSKNRTAETYRDRWYQRTTVWQKCSDLCGKDCTTCRTKTSARSATV
jgi:hypothetical protein